MSDDGADGRLIQYRFAYSSDKCVLAPEFSARLEEGIDYPDIEIADATCQFRRPNEGGHLTATIQADTATKVGQENGAVSRSAPYASLQPSKGEYTCFLQKEASLFGEEGRKTG